MSKWTRSALSLAVLAGGTTAMYAPLAPLAAAVASVSACTTETCVGATAVYNQGTVTGPDDWESNPIDGNWLSYSPELNLVVQIPAFAGRTLKEVKAEISPVENPNAPLKKDDSPNNWTTASGNLAEFQLAGSVYPDVGQPFFEVTVHNDTCAEYFVRILVTMEPVTPEPDASAPPHASDAAAPVVSVSDAAKD